MTVVRDVTDLSTLASVRLNN